MRDLHMRSVALQGAETAVTRGLSQSLDVGPDRDRAEEGISHGFDRRVGLVSGNRRPRTWDDRSPSTFDKREQCSAAVAEYQNQPTPTGWSLQCVPHRLSPTMARRSNGVSLGGLVSQTLTGAFHSAFCSCFATLSGKCAPPPCNCIPLGNSSDR